ncbi:hypothetical protein GQ457_15G029990 [Hibiscus cannabinus]
MVEEAILQLIGNKDIKIMRIADLGCSSGPNTLSVISEIVSVVQATCGHLGRPVPEFRLFLNNLYSNDFNYLFVSLLAFIKRLKEDKGIGEATQFFISGVPGSFYSRLFPTNTLHFVYSFYSLNLLSQVTKVYSFNAPCYVTCAKEIKEGIEKEGTFIIDRLEAFEVDWHRGVVTDIHTEQGNALFGEQVAKTVRAVAESMLESHFHIGQDRMDILFAMFAENVSTYLS